MKSCRCLLSAATRRRVCVATLLRSNGCRWQSSFAEDAHTRGETTAASAPRPEPVAPTDKDTPPSDDTAGAATSEVRYASMDQIAAARREIFALWQRILEREEAGAEDEQPTDGDGTAPRTVDEERLAGVRAIMQTYNIDPTTPREQDVCRGLGEALDRLLLLCVPLSHTTGTETLEKVLHVAGRQGREWTMRTIQHLFARVGGFAEALALFHAMRRCHFAMNMEAYHAMLYSLQRLEEEGWGRRFREECRTQGLSEQALDFVLRGVDNQLLPENKPWLGRIMFAEPDEGDAVTQQHTARKAYDDMGKLWVQRFRGHAATEATLKD